jgi:hypothetical protein
MVGFSAVGTILGLASGGRDGGDILQLMFRAELDALFNWADMQGNVSNAFNELMRRPLFDKLSTNPALWPLLRVTTLFYGRPSTMYFYEPSIAFGSAMLRIPTTRGVHHGCVLGTMVFAIVASSVYKWSLLLSPTNPLRALFLKMDTTWDRLDVSIYGELMFVLPEVLIMYMTFTSVHDAQ